MAPSAKSSPAPRLPKRRQQVAAVCYRIRKRGIEFLLVQTRGGRWIFPKGGVEPGLTHAQSAALEAFEEAGVHGRMEKIAFARYFRRKPGAVTATNDRRSSRPLLAELAVTAHLCEVYRLEMPQESNRNPTWFSPEKAKQRLFEGRAPEFWAELARVVDHAVTRIERREIGRHPDLDKDALQKVRFEALDDERVRADLMRAVLARHFLSQRREVRPVATISAAVQTQIRKYLQIGGVDEVQKPILRLSTGGVSTETLHKVTTIDTGRTVNLPKAAGRVVRSRTNRKSK